MSRRWVLIGWSLAAALAGTITACDKPPTGPTPPPGGNAATPTPTRLEITGPRAIVPGVPTQFTATVQMSDGSSRDVTTSTSWRTAPNINFVVSAAGILTARRVGSIDLSAAYGGLTSTREVIAVPEGTFRLTGIVTDVTAPAGPVNDAQVQVTDGTGRGQHSGTGTDGRYVLFGVAGDIELRVTKNGYRERKQRVMVTDHQTLDLDLPIVAQVPDVSGSWVLTITAADTCSAALPAEALSRTYAASIKQVGPELKIDLGGARFVNFGFWDQNVIAGRVAPDRVEFNLGEVHCWGYHWCDGDAVIEELAPSRVYVPSGGVRLAIAPAVLSGELNGQIAIHTRSAIETFSPESFCRSSRHRVTLSK